MKTPYILWVVVILILPGYCFAASKPDQSLDVQARFPINIQYLNQNTNRFINAGATVRLIFPDVTAKDNETARLYLAGPLISYGKQGSTVELLGGERHNEDGFQDPIVNLRLLDRSLPRLYIGADLMLFPREERRRLYSLFTLETPLLIGSYQMRYGLESDNTFSFAGKEDSIGFGPRVVFPLPLQKISQHLTAALAVGYQVRSGSDPDFLRCYFTLTYRLGKK
ncbi:MAG: hypothetical protein V4526_02305 [Patescibacteria group bacterium]